MMRLFSISTSYSSHNYPGQQPCDYQRGLTVVSSQVQPGVAPAPAPAGSQVPQPLGLPAAAEPLLSLISSLLVPGGTLMPNPGIQASSPAPRPAAAAIFSQPLPGVAPTGTPTTSLALESAMAPASAHQQLPSIFSLPGLSGSAISPSAAAPFNLSTILDAFLPAAAAALSTAGGPSAGLIAPVPAQNQSVVVSQPPGAAPSAALNPFAAIFQSALLIVLTSFY